MEKDNRFAARACRCAVLFLLFCAVGWVYEVALAFLYGYGFINRGFLFGPWLPLYGFGGLLLLGCLRPLMGRPVRLGPLPATPLLVAGGAALIATAVEYAVGWGLEQLFHQRWWDYSTYRFQLHGRICLSASLRFGLGSLLFLYLLAPLGERLARRIPRHRQGLAAAAITATLLLDLLFTLLWASSHGFDPTLAQPR